jgi:hypothetical protein
LDNKEIRRKILEFIYQKNEEKPGYRVKREELQQYLDIPDNKLINNILYLEEKCYLKLQKSIGSQFVDAQINSYGIDLVENPDEFNNKFPINITQNVIQNSKNIIIGNKNVQTISISDSFNSIYNDIEKKDPENKDQILNKIKEIEQELKKENPKKSVLIESILFLKENAAWIVPTIREIITATFGV